MRCIKSLFLIALLLGLAISCAPKKQPKTSFVVARSLLWKSINMEGMEKNVIGFSDDLLSALGREEKLRFSVVEVDIADMLSILQNPKIDAIFSGIEPTEELKRTYIFSEPYFSMGTVLIVRSDSPVESYLEMTGKTVGFLRTDLLLFQQRSNIYPNIVPYDNLSEAFNDLYRGVLEGLVADNFMASRYLSGLYKDKFHLAGEALQPMGLRLVTLKSKDDALISKFNEGLAKLKNNGLYSKMLAYWGLTPVR